MLAGNHQLPQAETAIAGGHLGLCKESQTRCVEPLFQAILELSILKATAAQADVLQLGALAYAANDYGEDINKAIVERSAHDALRDTAPKVISQRDEQWRGFDLEAVIFAYPERIRTEILARIAACCECNHGLRLMRHVRSGQRQCGNRV